MKSYVLIGLDGKEIERLKGNLGEQAPAWLHFQGRRFGFAVAKLSGEAFFYEYRESQGSSLARLGSLEGNAQ